MKRAMKQSTLVLLLNVCSVIFLVGVIVAFCVSNQLGQKIANANENRFELTYNANRFMNGSAYLTNEVRAYAATGKQEHFDNYWNEVNTLKNRDLGVEAMKAIGITASEQALIDEMSQLSNTLVPLEENAMNDVAAGNLDNAIGYVYGTEYSTEIAKINEIKSTFLNALDTRTKEEIDSLTGTNKMVSYILYVLIGLVVIMQAINYRVTRKKILHPIQSIQDEMSQIAQGNLSSEFLMEADTSEIGMLVYGMQNTKQELKKYIHDITEKLSLMAKGNMNLSIDIDYVGDFIPIKESLHTILEFLNSALTQIDQSAEQVASSAGQVARASSELSSGAGQQANAIEELAQRITDISQQINENASNALQASVQANAVGDEMTQSKQQMDEMIVAMKEISQSSDEIGKIIKAIEDIAFQTNILALNAAVEAARAGAAGKGFAVVADEVRNLASKSAEASKSTADLVLRSLRAVENGTRIADETAKSLVNAVDGAKGVAKTVDKISSATNEQADSINQVTQGIESISNVVHTNTANAEESAAASQELSGQASMLKGLVGRFQLGKNY